MANLNPNRDVYVVNKNVFAHSEKFRGDVVTIEKGGKLRMNREDAVLFKSQFYQPKYDGNGVQRVDSYKMISLEEIPEEIVKDLPPERNSENDCMACGEKCKDKKALSKHLKDSPGCAARLIDEKAQKEIFGD